jgi:hypothetical protein
MELRSALNEYCDALHRPRATGQSAFTGIARLIGLRHEHDVGLDLGDPDAMDAARSRELRELVEILAEEAHAVDGGVARHPLLPVGLVSWSPSIKQEVEKSGAAFDAAAHALRAATDPVAEAMGLGPADRNLAELERLRRWCRLTLASHGAPDELLTEGDWEAARERIAGWVVQGRRRDELRAELFAVYRPEILNLHLTDLQQRLERASRKWPLFRWFTARPARRALREVLTSPDRLAAPEDLLRHLATARRLRDLTNQLAQPGHEAERLLGRHWKSGEAEWARVESIVAWADAIRGLLTELAEADLDRRDELRARWLRVLAEGRDLLAPLEERLEAAYAEFDRCRSHFVDLLHLDETPDATLEALRDDAVAIVDQRDELRTWCGYRRATAGAREAGLAPLFAALEEGDITTETLPTVFERSFLAWWVARHIDGDEALEKFSSTRQNLAIRKFRGLDEAVMELARDYCHERLAARLPRPGAESSKSASSEMGLLHRELSKKRRHLPLRRLFERIPNVLARLKPCVLMSPLSVAQYLSPDFERFDLTVFDETWSRSSTSASPPACPTCGSSGTIAAVTRA